MQDFLKTHWLFFLVLVVGISACSEQESSGLLQENLLYEKVSDKSFEDTLLDLEFAIGEQNFRIIENLKIGEAIQERGNNNFPKNEVIIFCNLQHAEKMLSKHPEFISYCPFRASVREFNNTVMTSTLLLPGKDNDKAFQLLTENINQILKDIVNYAVEDDPFILDAEYED